MSLLLSATALGLLMTQEPTPLPPPIPAPPSPPVYTVSAPPSPPVPAGPGVVRRPVAIDRRSWIEIDDYPAAALRAEEQGLVMVVLQVGANGRVSDCRITFSSESAALDAATCRLFRSRARYRPARNADDEAVVGMIREQVRWVLPAEPIVFTPSYALVSVRQVDGRVGTCRPARLLEGSRLTTETCNTFAPIGPRAPEAVAQGRSRFGIAMEIEPDGAPPVERPALPAGLRPLLEASASVELDASGVIAACRSRPTSGDRARGFDLCSMLRRPEIQLFDPPGEEGHRRGRITVTTYQDITAR